MFLGNYMLLFKLYTPKTVCLNFETQRNVLIWVSQAHGYIPRFMLTPLFLVLSYGRKTKESIGAREFSLMRNAKKKSFMHFLWPICRLVFVSHQVKESSSKFQTSKTIKIQFLNLHHSPYMFPLDSSSHENALL